MAVLTMSLFVMSVANTSTTETLRAPSTTVLRDRSAQNYVFVSFDVLFYLYIQSHLQACSRPLTISRPFGTYSCHPRRTEIQIDAWIPAQGSLVVSDAPSYLPTVHGNSQVTRAAFKVGPGQAAAETLFYRKSFRKSRYQQLSRAPAPCRLRTVSDKKRSRPFGHLPSYSRLSEG